MSMVMASRLTTSRSMLYVALGFKGDRLPLNLMSTHFMLEGVHFVLRPSNHSTLCRLFLECPNCKRLVSTGRFHQHAKIHTDRTGWLALEAEARDARMAIRAVSYWGREQPRWAL